MIDVFDLETAISEQSDIFYKVSMYYTEACEARDTVKNELSIKKAYVSKKLRGDKLAEGAITKMLDGDSEIKLLNKKYIRKKFVSEKLLVLVESFRQRSYMLKELVALYVSNYYIDDGSVIDRAHSNAKANKAKEEMRKHRNTENIVRRGRA